MQKRLENLRRQDNTCLAVKGMVILTHKSLLPIVLAITLMGSSILSLNARKIWYDDIPINFHYEVSFTYDLDSQPKDPYGDFKEAVNEHEEELGEAVQEALLNKIQERQSRDTLSIEDWELEIILRGPEDEDVTVRLSMKVMGAVYEEGDDYHCAVKWRDVNCVEDVEVENKYGRALKINPAKMLGFQWIAFSNNIHEGWNAEQEDNEFTISEEREWNYEGVNYNGEQEISVPFTEVTYRDDTIESPNESTLTGRSTNQGEDEEETGEEGEGERLVIEIRDIPGFPAESILLGLAAAVIVLLSKHRTTPNLR